MSRVGTNSVMQITTGTPASAASSMASAACGAGTKITDTLAPCSATAARTVSYTGVSSSRWPPRPGVTPATTAVP